MKSSYFMIVICLFFFTIGLEEVQARPGLNSTFNLNRCQHASPRPGYKHLPNHGHYKFHPQKVPWLLAYVTCEWECGHLVVLNSEDEAKAVATLWQTGQSAWIGTHDLFDEGVYVTIFDETIYEAGYHKVYPGELNGGADENCGCMGNNGELVNHWCHENLPFVCEFNA